MADKGEWPTGSPSSVGGGVEKKSKREHVAREIASSELNYVQSLQGLSESFIIPLQKAATDPAQRCPVTEEQIAVLFSNIQLILNFNSKFCSDLEKRMQDWQDATTYLSNHDSAIQLLTKLEKKQESKNPGESLNSYLIKPIQRIPRYKLLLEELLKATDLKHADHENLTRALDLVSVVASQINESLRSFASSRDLLALQEQFAGRPELLAPGRHFIRNGPLMKASRTKSENDREYEFFLFNDLLIYAAREPVRKALGAIAFSAKMPQVGLFKIHGRLPIDKSFFVQDLQDKDHGPQNRFQIISFQKSFILYTMDKETKVSWLDELYGCIKQVREESLMQSNENIPVAPVMQPKSDFATCRCCKEPFSFFKWKYHCENCGSVVCDPCSSRRIMKKNIQRFLRVCDQCVIQLCKVNQSNEDNLATSTILQPPSQSQTSVSHVSHSVSQAPSSHHASMATPSAPASVITYNNGNNQSSARPSRAQVHLASSPSKDSTLSSASSASHQPHRKEAQHQATHSSHSSTHSDHSHSTASQNSQQPRPSQAPHAHPSRPAHGDEETSSAVRPSMPPAVWDPDKPSGGQRKTTLKASQPLPLSKSPAGVSPMSATASVSPTSGSQREAGEALLRFRQSQSRSMATLRKGQVSPVSSAATTSVSDSMVSSVASMTPSNLTAASVSTDPGDDIVVLDARLGIFNLRTSVASPQASMHMPSTIVSSVSEVSSNSSSYVYSARPSVRPSTTVFNSSAFVSASVSSATALDFPSRGRTETASKPRDPAGSDHTDAQDADDEETPVDEDAGQPSSFVETGDGEDVFDLQTMLSK